MPHDEHHRSHRTGWLRAAVLGANDGVVSTASLILGVAASNANHDAIVTAGVAALVAGAMSMAAGEYVSVRSQADTEEADLKLERRGLEEDAPSELEELAEIYVGRGLEPELAKKVAEQLSAHDALAAHARDELGITEELAARPFQAAFASAASFFVGAIVPLGTAVAAPTASVNWCVGGISLVFLALLGGVAAQAGGAKVLPGAIRVLFWGGLAMVVTMGVGALLGTAI